MAQDQDPGPKKPTKTSVDPKEDELEQIGIAGRRREQ